MALCGETVDESDNEDIEVVVFAVDEDWLPIVEVAVHCGEQSCCWICWFAFEALCERFDGEAVDGPALARKSCSFCLFLSFMRLKFDKIR